MYEIFCTQRLLLTAIYMYFTGSSLSVTSSVLVGSGLRAATSVALPGVTLLTPSPTPPGLRWVGAVVTGWDTPWT